jgi:MFS family permease
MAPVSQLSCLWFAPHERTRATTVAIFANNFGATIGFLISPYIVSAPDDVPNLLYVHFGLASVGCLLALIYFPAQPPSAPSAAAELLINNPTSTENSHDWRTFFKDIWTCLSNPAFLFLCTAGGLVFGTFGAWTSLYDVLLEPEHYSEAEAGNSKKKVKCGSFVTCKCFRLVWIWCNTCRNHRWCCSKLYC